MLIITSLLSAAAYFSVVNVELMLQESNSCGGSYLKLTKRCTIYVGHAVSCYKKTVQGLQWVPLSENLIFSNLGRPKMLCNQTLVNGGCGDFHCNRILLRATSEGNARTLFWTFVAWRSSGALPKIAIWGVGIRFMPSMSDTVLRKLCQNSNNLGHAQNMWVRLQGRLWAPTTLIIKSLTVFLYYSVACEIL